MTNLYFFALALGGLTLLASLALGGAADRAEPSRRRGPLTSPRFWTFGLIFFGLTGLVLQALEVALDPHVIIGLAAAIGASTGIVAHGILSRLARTENSTAADARDFVGKSGRVLVGFGPGELGKVRVTIRGTTVDVLARTDEAEPFVVGESALIIHMQESGAAVIRPARSDD